MFIRSSGQGKYSCLLASSIPDHLSEHLCTLYEVQGHAPWHQLSSINMNYTEAQLHDTKGEECAARRAVCCIRFPITIKYKKC
jgi:hypothetical protein